MFALIAVRSVSEILFGSSSTFGEKRKKKKITNMDTELSVQVNKTKPTVLFTFQYKMHICPFININWLYDTT